MNNLTKILEAAKARQAKEDDNKSGKEQKVPAGGKTLTQQQHNEIDVKPVVAPLREDTDGKHIVTTFGRMNPPTVGHEKLVNHVKNLAKKHNGEAHVFLSHTEGNKKNPLSYVHKHKLATVAFGDVIKHVPSEHSHVLGVAKHLDGKADHLHMVVGSDRVAEVTKKLHAYNGKEYNYKSITVHSAGHRDDDAGGVEGMSASKMRAAAGKGDHEAFKSGLPSSLHHKSHEIMKAVSGKSTIGENIAETLNPQQRMKRAIQFKRMASRVQLGRKRAMRRRAPRDVLTRRSRRLAIKFMRARVIRGQNYSDLPYATRAIIDKRLSKRKKSIKRIAQRLMPRVARAESQRKLGGAFRGIATSHANVAEETLLELVESVMQRVSQDYEYELLPQELNHLNERAIQEDLPVEMLESVFRRGLAAWQLDETTELSFSSYAFNRVNSFLAGGAAWDMDIDLFVESYDGESIFDTHGKKKVSVNHRTAAGPGKFKKAIVKKVIGEESTKKSPADKLNDRLNKLDPKRLERHKQFADLAKKYKKVNEESLDGEKRRIDMPQLTDFDAFHKDLTDGGHQLGHEYLKPDTLAPLQKHFNQEKVDRLKKTGWGDKSIIVSADNHIIDGHHRWVAAKQMGVKIRARVASLKADELLDFVKGKPYVEKKKLDEAYSDDTNGESHLEIEFDEKGVHKVTHIKGTKLEESSSDSDPLADHEFHKVLSKFKPSKLDHETIQKELHHHLAKHGLYSHSDRHPLIRNPAENKHLVDWSRVTAHKEAKHIGWHSDTTGNPETTRGNHHVAVWSTQHPTHVRDAELGKHGHDDSGRPKQRPGGTKPEHGGGKINHEDGHVVVFNDVKAQHKASDNKDSHDRWFARIHNVRKIPEKGLVVPGTKGETHFGKDIHSYVDAKKATRDRPKEAVTGWLAKNEKHKSYDKAVEHAKKNGLYDEKAIADKKKKLNESVDQHADIHKRAMDHYDKAGQISDHSSSAYHNHMANHHEAMGQYSAASGRLKAAETHYNNAQRHVRQQFAASIVNGLRK